MDSPSHLKDSAWPTVLTTSGNDLIQDFFVPALRCAETYCRGVGFFSGAWMRVAAAGMVDFAARGGVAHWVTSPILSPDDWEAMQIGDSAKTDATLREAMLRNVLDLAKTLEDDTLSAIAWMVADGVLDFKLALPRSKLKQGEFHDKFGVFTDSAGDRISFNGSYNDSMQGLLNYESIKVFTSWTEWFAPLVEADQRRFDDLWDNRDQNVEVFDIPSACRAEILKLRSSERPYTLPPWVDRVAEGPGRYGAAFTPPPGFEPREYQKTAMRKWLDNKGRGILAMATGTGKTSTALYLAYKVTQKVKPCLLIVVCPYLNLARQWKGAMRDFGLQPVCCHDAWTTWHGSLQNALTGLAVGAKPLVSVVVTNATFLSPRFQRMIAVSTVARLLIADEVHNLGADGLRETLDPTIQYRLGLSATPERHGDALGTAALMEYFGGVVYEYGLADAIRDGVLCRYLYHPVLVDLDDGEAEQYWELTQRITRLIAMREDSETGAMSTDLKMLLMRRARLLGAAKSKLPALERILGGLSEPLSRAIVYCGDGRVESEASGDPELLRQVEAAVRLLGGHLGHRVRKFTCDEAMDEREEILRLLRDGVIDAAVAIRCLDEGIDIPDVRMGFLLASSTNPRQFIQRRGRLLRKAAGKTRAEIWDFIVRPPDFGGQLDDAAFNIERRLFARELLRIVEFCHTAENGDTALHTLADLRRQYNLLDVGAPQC